MKRKVLILIPSLRIGGAEKILINVLNLLDRSKLEILLFVGYKTKVSLRSSLPEDVICQYLYPNAFTARVNAWLFRKTGSKKIFNFFGGKITGDYNTGLSFLDGPFSQFLFSNNAHIKKKGVVLHSSYKSFGDMNKAVNSPHYSRMMERYKKLDFTIAVSNEVKNEFLDLFTGINNVSVIYNPINSARVKELAKEENSVARQIRSFKFLACGNLVPVKGFERLIRAASLVKMAGYDFTIFIVGDGPLKQKLSNLVRDLDLENTVLLLGYQSNPYKFMADVDAFVMSSYSEGLPTVLCEAMILDKPVLVPDITGCRELVDHGKFGLMVSDSEEGIAEGLKKLLTDKELLEFYQHQSEIRKELFDDDKVISQYQSILEN